MKTLLRIAISAALLTWVGMNTDWPKVGQSFAKLQIGWWFGAVAVLMLCQVISAKRWHLIARSMRFERTWPQMTSFYLIGMYFNLVLPTSVGGDVFRAYYLNGGSGRKLAALVSVFLDRFTGLLVLLTMAAGAVFFSPLELPTWIPWFVYSTAAGGYLALAALPVISHFGKSDSVHIQKIRATWKVLRHPGVLTGALLLSVIVQAASVLLCWMTGMAIGANVPISFYWILVPTVSLLTMLPISVNGMGLREWGVTFMLAPLGVDTATALSLAFLWFAVFAFTSLLAGFVYMFGKFPKPERETKLPEKEQTDDGSVDNHSDQGRARKPQRVA